MTEEQARKAACRWTAEAMKAALREENRTDANAGTNPVLKVREQVYRILRSMEDAGR